MTFETIAFEKRGAAAWVTLNRPDVLNAFNVRMRDELYEVCGAVRDDDEIRAVVFRGAGRAFCAGADLTEFGTAPSPTAARRIRFARDLWERLAALRVPRIAALHGFVVGSGVELALLCDLRIAAEGTTFRLPEAHLGMIPAAGATQTLPRVAGVGVALSLILTGRAVEADEAARLRIVTWVVPPERLEDETTEVADSLCRLDPRVVAGVLRAVHEGVDLPLAQGLQLEARLAAGGAER
ncbi:MAG TPA: enoyl-CoA hydratase/isomerase family protein [Gaiellaceae bacterium]|nr:enoyl-CoA hydratase/isomerase family protein [Gaiellaceae bacterium]